MVLRAAPRTDRAAGRSATNAADDAVSSKDVAVRRDVFVTGAASMLLVVPAAGEAQGRRRRRAFGAPDDGRYGAGIDLAEFAQLQGALPPSAFTGTPFDVRRPFAADAPAVTLDQPAGRHGPGRRVEAGLARLVRSRLVRVLPRRLHRGAQPRRLREVGRIRSEQRTERGVAVPVGTRGGRIGKRPCPKGSKATPYANRLVRDGAPSAAQVPYNPRDAATPAKLCTYIRALNVRSSPGTTAAARRQLQGVLAHRGTESRVAARVQGADPPRARDRVHGPVATGYNAESPQLTNRAWTAPQGFKAHSGHGQVIVGFDDGVGHGGGFLVQNSFGADWNPGNGPGHNGRIYWDYDTSSEPDVRTGDVFQYERPVAGTCATLVGVAPRSPVEGVSQRAPVRGARSCW